MPQVTKDSITGRYCRDLGGWFDTQFGADPVEESTMVQTAAEQGHYDAVIEYVTHVLAEDDVVDRCVRAIASLPASEGDRWKGVVDIASAPDPDVGLLRSAIQGFPHDSHMVGATMAVVREAIMGQDEAERPNLWVQLIAAART